MNAAACSVHWPPRCSCRSRCCCWAGPRRRRCNSVTGKSSEALAEARPVTALRTLADAERAFLRAGSVSPYRADLTLARMTVALTIAKRVQPARRALCGLDGAWAQINADPIVAGQAAAARDHWLLLKDCPATAAAMTEAAASVD